MRDATPYAEGRDWTAPAGYEAFSPDLPVAGFYRMRLRSGGVHAGIKVWHGAPLDPETGEEMDRGWRWQALANGSYIDLDRVWPACAREPITEIEYNRLTGLRAWAVQHAPESGIADPTRPLDLLKSPLVF